MRVLSTNVKEQVVAVGFTPGRPLLVAVTECAVHPGGVRVWNLSSPGAPLTFAHEIQFYRKKPLLFSPDGRRLIDQRRLNRSAIDLETGKVGTSRLSIESEVDEFDQTADGTRLVTVHESAAVLMGWRRKNNEWTEDWAVHMDPPETYGIALAPGGDRLAHLLRTPETGRTESVCKLAIRSALTGVQLERGECPNIDRTQLLFRPDAAQVVAVHEATLLVWPVPEPRRPRTIQNDGDRDFTSAAYHPSSQCLFTTSNDATVAMWDTTTWKTINRFKWDVGRLLSVAVSPDGTLAAAGSDKGQVVVWDVDL